MTPEEELYLFQRISQMADKYIPTKKVVEYTRNNLSSSTFRS